MFVYDLQFALNVYINSLKNSHYKMRIVLRARRNKKEINVYINSLKNSHYEMRNKKEIKVKPAKALNY